MKNTKFPQIFIEYYIGIDVSKDFIHCYSRPDGVYKKVANNKKAIESYIRTVLKDKKVACIVMEATGGYELYAAETFAKAGYYVVVLNPKRARHLMSGMGINPKTDKVDAEVLAKIAQRFWGDEDVLSAYEPMSKEQKKLQRAVNRYNQLTNDIVRCKNRLRKAEFNEDKVNAKSLKRQLKWLLKERKAYMQDIRLCIASDPQMARWDEILQSVPGIANVVSALLIAFLPELGKLNRERIASLAGLAPHPSDSGTKQGSREAKKGRQKIKWGWMPAIASAIKNNPVLKDFYQRLTARGKEPKVAMIASMRKLLVIVNQMIRNNQKWGENKIQKNELQDNAQTASDINNSIPAADTWNNSTEQNIEEQSIDNNRTTIKKQTSKAKSTVQRKKQESAKSKAVKLI